jgi:Cu2+-exporting ATPase
VEQRKTDMDNRENNKHSDHMKHGKQNGDDHDHQSHHAHMVADFRLRFRVSIVLTVPILALAPLIQSLIGVAVIVACTYSSGVVFGLSGKIFFWELASLIDSMLLGHWIEMRSAMGA